MSFIASKLRAGMTPKIRELPLAAGATGLKGALMLMDVNGAWATCGADPASIGGIAQSDYGPDTTGFVHTGTKNFPPGYLQCAVISDNQPFHARYIGTLPAAAGGSFGVVLDSDGLWKVDFTETVNTRLKLVSIEWTASPFNVARVEVVFLAANTQIIV
jgi:hypothetical protein